VWRFAHARWLPEGGGGTIFDLEAREWKRRERRARAPAAVRHAEESARRPPAVQHARVSRSSAKVEGRGKDGDQRDSTKNKPSRSGISEEMIQSVRRHQKTSARGWRLRG
jgi:hypothetical protein